MVRQKGGGPDLLTSLKGMNQLHHIAFGYRQNIVHGLMGNTKVFIEQIQTTGLETPSVLSASFGSCIDSLFFAPSECDGFSKDYVYLSVSSTHPKINSHARM